MSLSLMPRQVITFGLQLLELLMINKRVRLVVVSLLFTLALTFSIAQAIIAFSSHAVRPSCACH